MNQTQLLDALSTLGFSPPDGTSSVLEKAYANGYRLSIELGATPAETKIDYGNTINAQCGRNTTRQFAQAESLVVLECVDTLLTVGYQPSAIYLEQPFVVGTTQVWLDVLVKNDAVPYLMIDCKTWGPEFTAAKSGLFNSGGQLLSYYLQDRRAKFISYYASRLAGGMRERDICAVDTAAFPPEAATLQEIVQQWDKSYFSVGLVENLPYQVQERRLLKSDLRDITADDRGKVFNSFAEILRRHVVSDKPNAFNKLFNLIICKIYDEEKQPGEALEFQWAAGEDTDVVLARLNELYRRGMQQYLSVEIPEFSTSSIIGDIHLADDHQREKLVNFINALKSYSSQEFAFKEVFDSSSHAGNAAVVREVVRLLQPLRLRYGSRQPFLGEFFEQLLGMSVKQESGQFFTPVPIARFIINSLPLSSIVQNKVAAQDNNFLPYIMDFASGSGHFITTGMEAIDELLCKIPDDNLRQTQRANRDRWKVGYSWAGEFVYGIEKDYRLAKASKVSCFLNGDGDAHVICADGLDNFALSKDYIDKLKLPASAVDQRDNAQFDVVVANPPYAVEQCRATIPHGGLSFELYPHLRDTSNEIECLFVERMKQLLKSGGVGGIILPVSLLSSSGIEAEARRILLDNFLIRGLVLLRDNTFMATTTNTVVLFVTKRKAPVMAQLEAAVRQFWKNWSDVAVLGTAKAFSTYVNSVWSVPYEQWLALVREGTAIDDCALYRDYRTAFAAAADTRRSATTRQFKSLSEAEQAEQLRARFIAFVRDRELKKISLYLAVKDQQVVIVRPPKDPQENKRFLGYEFSRRRGQEGMRYVGGGSSINSPLFDEADPDNPTKISFLLRQSFLGGATVPEHLKAWCEVEELSDLLEWDLAEPKNTIRVTVKKKRVTDARYPVFRVREVLDEVSTGVGAVPVRAVAETGGVPVISQDRELIAGYANSAEKIEGKHLPLIVFGDHSKTVKYVDFPFLVGGQGVKLLRPKGNPSAQQVKLFYYILKHNKPESYSNYQRHYSAFRDEYIPVPSEPKATKLVDVCERIDEAGKAARTTIADSLHFAAAALSKLGGRAQVSDFCSFSGTRVEPAALGDGDVSYVGMEDVEKKLGILSTDWSASPADQIDSTKFRFEAGDVLFGRLRPYLAKVLMTDFDGVCSTEFAVLRPTVDPTLLKFALLHPNTISTANDITRGMGRPRITENQVMALDLPNLGVADDAVIEDLRLAARTIERARARLLSLQERQRRVVDGCLWEMSAASPP